MSVTIRPAVLSDWDGFQAAFALVAAEGLWIGRELPIDWDAMRPSFQARFGDARWLSLMAVDEDRIVGWAQAEHERTGRASLGMGLVDGYRGAGIGARLLSPVIAWAREQTVHKVCLEVWAHNARALRLYEKHGFVVEGRHARHWRRNDGALWDIISMGLVLDADSPGGPAS